MIQSIVITGAGPSAYYQRIAHAQMQHDLWVRYLDKEVNLDQVIDRLVAVATAEP